MRGLVGPVKHKRGGGGYVQGLIAGNFFCIHINGGGVGELITEVLHYAFLSSVTSKRASNLNIYFFDWHVTSLSNMRIFFL